jgi:signal transduction histidine kinase
MIAFEVVKSGNVGVSGSTGAVLQRSLSAARDLIARSAAEVEFTRGVQNRERFLVSGFIEELAPVAKLAADARGVTFTVIPVDDRVAVEADRQVLSAVVLNVLQNAFRFTRPRSAVTLRVGAGAERVVMEIEDECGGLADGSLDNLFQPFVEPTNRRSLGFGLAFSRWATEANRGRISARSLPGVGCIFTVDLPRVPEPALPLAHVVHE